MSEIKITQLKIVSIKAEIDSTNVLFETKYHKIVNNIETKKASDLDFLHLELIKLRALCMTLYELKIKMIDYLTESVVDFDKADG